MEFILELHPSAVVDSKLERVSVLKRISEFRVQKFQHRPHHFAVDRSGKNTPGVIVAA
jgi:hypothetical protein